MRLLSGCNGEDTTCTAKEQHHRDKTYRLSLFALNPGGQRGAYSIDGPLAHQKKPSTRRPQSFLVILQVSTAPRECSGFRFDELGESEWAAT